MVTLRQAFITATIALLFSTMAVSVELSDGQLLYRKYQCQICHGEKGHHSAQDGFPVIGGQNKTYLTRQIIDIRDRVRDNGKTDLMRPLIQTLKNKEVEAISAFLSKQ